MPAPPSERVGTPRFSIVSAVYNVAAYLTEFIASIEGQDRSLDDVEVILVDDGSTDESPQILREWQQRRPELVTIVTKSNGGQASARNAGLDRARGEWITFTDPDDTWEPDALSQMLRFLDANPAVHLAGMRRVLFDEASGRRKRHPLDSHFGKRVQVRDLEVNPGHFFGSAPCAFFRRDLIERFGVRFREEIRPSFEDGYFCCEYLLRIDRPVVGFVRDSVYIYRKRADNSSTLSQGRHDAARYTTLLQVGYLGILEESVRLRGAVPGWLQSYILYELSWFFTQEARSPSPVVIPIADQVHEVLGRIVAHLDRRLIRSYWLRRLKPEWRDALIHGFDDRPWHSAATVDRVDLRQRQLRVSYRFIGELPEERFVVDGVEVRPNYSKIRSQPYFQRTVVRHRIVWLNYGAVRVTLDGVPVDIATDDSSPTAELPAWRAREALAPRPAKSATSSSDGADLGRRDRLVARLARTRVVRRLLRRSWVLMDRVHDADDSAEHLFRYLRDNRPDVNAWFVIERDVPHARQLRRDGYKRIVWHGSLRWKLLMLNCDQLISSHADEPILQPSEIVKFGPTTWRTVFLQHGVTKDDLSAWLNHKALDLFVVSTPAELHSVVDDDTAYEYTERETKLTGLPRFDKVRAVAGTFPPERRDLVLVAPTWRRWLVEPVPDTQRWTIDRKAFLASDFARNWSSFLTSADLTDHATRHGLHIGLLMHPNLQAAVPWLELPPEVEILDFDSGVLEAFGRARVVVTDYSSMSFNAVYVDRPVVYFQFDRDGVLGGQHVGTKGYFDYETHGFGPVTTTAADAVAETVAAIEHGPAPADIYAKRIAEAFPVRDGRCCERVADAIIDSVKRVPSAG